MLLSVVFLLSFVGSTSADIGISKNEMFSYGAATGDFVRNVTGLFDNSALLDLADQITITNGIPFKIFGATLSNNVFINYNGHVTFGAAFNAYDPLLFNSTSQSNPIFNVFFSDNDLRRSPGLLYHRLSTRQSDLNFADSLIRGRGYTNFQSKYCIIATWEDIKYYIRNENSRSDPNLQQENTYQLALCTDGVDGHYIYHYHKLEWARSQDTSTNFATVGLYVKDAAQNLRFWSAPYSGTSNIQRMATNSNVGKAGRWMRTKAVVGPCVGLADDVYVVNCTHYRFCCNQVSELVVSCPDKTSFHPTLKYCVMNEIYNCGGSNLCVGKSDGNYAYIATQRQDDFYRCRSGLARILFCPNGITFGSSQRCR